MSKPPPCPPARSAWRSAALPYLATGCLISVLLTWVFVVHLCQWQLPLKWDSHAFVLMARWWLNFGLWPYADTVELKPPGIFLYLVGLWSIFPMAMWPVRIVDTLLAAAGAIAVFVAVEGSRPARLVASLWFAYWQHHGLLDIGGLYTEQYVAIFAALAWATRRRPWLAGVLAGVGMSFKHVGASVLLPLCLSGAWMAVPVAALTFLASLLPWAVSGRGTAAWEIVMVQAWRYGRWPWNDVQGLTRMVVELTQRGGWLLLPLMIATVAVACLRPTRERAILLIWWLCECTLVAMQRGWAYHQMIPTLTPTALLIGSVIHALPLRFVTAALLSGFIVVQVRPAVVQSEWRNLRAGRWPEGPSPTAAEQVGRWLAEQAKPTDTLHVIVPHGDDPAVYWYAGLRPAAGRYWHPYLGWNAPALSPWPKQFAALEGASWIVEWGTFDPKLRPSFPDLTARCYQLARTFAADAAVKVWQRREACLSN